MALLPSAIALFRATPRGSVGDGGRMALGDHLREARARILRSVLVLVLGMILGLVFFDELIELVQAPYNEARIALGEDVTTKPVILGIATSLLFQLKLAAMASVVLTSPYWLYQVWAFIVPGLHRHERRWTRVFVAIAGPLFLVGVATGYYVLPKGIEVLIGFTPENVENLVDFNDYLSFLIRMLLVFGVAFEIPLFVVMLNLAGVVSAKQLADHRGWIVVGVFVFAAAATPSTDPFSMVMLALPMTFLLFVAEIIARITDRRRAKADPFAGLADDEATPESQL